MATPSKWPGRAAPSSGSRDRADRDGRVEARAGRPPRPAARRRGRRPPRSQIARSRASLRGYFAKSVALAELARVDEDRRRPSSPSSARARRISDGGRRGASPWSARTRPVAAPRRAPREARRGCATSTPRHASGTPRGRGRAGSPPRPDDGATGDPARSGPAPRREPRRPSAPSASGREGPRLDVGSV